MPATRKARTSTGPALKGSQKTLSFSNKVSKPTSSASLKQKPEIPAKASDKALDLGHVTSEAAVVQQAKVELAKPEKEKTKEELEAEKVTNAQIGKYWEAREAERRAPRMHQEGLTVEEKILRLFDMSSQFGPSIGIARMKRWVRANKLGLHPPIEVLAVLLKEEKKGNTSIERAHVDELMSSNYVVGDA